MIFKTFAFRSIFILCFLISPLLHAQKEKKKKDPNSFEWGNLGMGFGLAELQSDITNRSFGVDYNHTLRFSKLFIQGGLQGTLYNDLPSLFDLHASLGYGIGYHKKYLLAFSLGPGYMSGETQYAEVYRGLGVNANAQFIFKPLDDLGIGVELYANYPFLTNIGNTPASNGIRVVICISSK